MVQAPWVSPPPALPALYLQACPFVDHHVELQVDVEFQPKNLAQQRVRHLVDEVVPNQVLEVVQNLEEGGQEVPEQEMVACGGPKPVATTRTTGVLHLAIRPAPRHWPEDHAVHS